MDSIKKSMPQNVTIWNFGHPVCKCWLRAWLLYPYKEYMLSHSHHPLCFREDLSKFMESKGAPTPGIMTLTACLSKPFVRLDRYPSLLKELERHIDGAHVDRGDTQRAIEVYRDIQVNSSLCRLFGIIQIIYDEKGYWSHKMQWFIKIVVKYFYCFPNSKVLRYNYEIFRY